MQLTVDRYAIIITTVGLLLYELLVSFIPKLLKKYKVQNYTLFYKINAIA